MDAKLQELTIRSNLRIRKSSIVTLNFWGDSKPLEVEVTDIFMRDNQIYIESRTRNFGSYMTHDSEQYEESATLIKF